MTDEEKEIIRKEIYIAYLSLKKYPSHTRWAIATKIGLNRAQEIINNNRKE